MRLIDADELGKKIHPGMNIIEVIQAIVDVPEIRWIPVSERLPDNDDMVLVTVQPKKSGPYVTRAFYVDDAGYLDDAGAWHGTWNMANITAWMPMPKPYGGPTWEIIEKLPGGCSLIRCPVCGEEIRVTSVADWKYCRCCGTRLEEA